MQDTTITDTVEEHHYRRGDIDFCFLLNRVHRNLRVFDYRVGNYQQKRDFFDRIARSEGLRKVFTVVEKQDSKSWRSVGFSREGAIPGYFRTADAYIMSRVYAEDGKPIPGGAPKLSTPSAKKNDRPQEKPKGLSLDVVTDVERIQKLTEELGEAALYAPFRRRVFVPDVAIQGKIGRRSLWVGAELDTSFGHAKIDLMSPPSKDTDIAPLSYCLRSLLEELARRDTASVFALAPVEWAWASQVYLNEGFKVTAKLTDHVSLNDNYVGVQLWHRRVGAPPAHAEQSA